MTSVTDVADSEAVAAFHRLYYNARVWNNTYWWGIPTYKCPFDLWIYQEIVFDLHPDVIVETGTFRGGSALFMAAMLDRIGRGSVITVDIQERVELPQHPRINYLVGPSTEPHVVQRVKGFIQPTDTVMVILDLLHHHEHVLQEMERYAPLVTPGSYLIVEDTNIGGNPVYTDYAPDSGPGPMEAVREFLTCHPDFAADREREKHMMTFNPGGYLRRSQQT